MGIVWVIIWMMLTYDKPANHPRISLKEKEYILSSIGSAQDKNTRVGQLFTFIFFCQKSSLKLSSMFKLIYSAEVKKKMKQLYFYTPPQLCFWSRCHSLERWSARLEYLPANLADLISEMRHSLV